MNLRGINVSAQEVKSTWDFYQNIDTNRRKVEDKRAAVAQRVKQLSKLPQPSAEEEQELNGLAVQGRVLKQELRTLKEILWELQETVIPRVLQLPNDLHKNTPETSEIVLKVVGTKPVQQSSEAPQDHVTIGKSLGLLDYLNQMHFYLCDEAALFEVAVQSYASQLLATEGLLRVAGTDFARSLLVEAAGMDHEDPFSTFMLKNNEKLDEKSVNRLHLIGGASLISFLAMHTKQLVNPKHFPLRYYATGRSYTPSVIKPMDLGLFGVCQTSAIHCMSIIRENDGECDNEFERLIDAGTKLYDGFGRHYRVVMRSAGQLEPAECCRVSFELWSTYYGDYVEVGHVSMYGDYLSKRLLIAYQTPRGRGYPAIISGTVLNVNRVLGCLLEENAEIFHVPEGVREFMPIGGV